MAQPAKISGIEIIVVDDDSDDGTARVAHKWARQILDIRLISDGGNRGKGHSVRYSVREALGRIVLFTDADLFAPIEESAKLLAAIEGGKDVAIGSRGLDRSLISV